VIIHAGAKSIRLIKTFSTGGVMKLIHAQRTVQCFFGCNDQEIPKLSTDEIIEMAHMIRSATIFSQKINARDDRFVVEVGFNDNEGFYANVWDRDSNIGGAMAGMLELLGQNVTGRANLVAWPFEIPSMEDLRSAIAEWADIPPEVAEKLEAARNNSNWEPTPASWYMPRDKKEISMEIEHDIIF